MSFSYNNGANPPIDYPRLLCADTQQYAPDGITPAYAFSDQEIAAATVIVALQFQSAQFYSPPLGVYSFPSPPTAYLRVAAMLLNALAANKARLSSIKQILDVKLDPKDAAEQMRQTAQMYLDMDDNSGAFCIIEQVNNDYSLIDRFWKQVQREQAQ